jgi:MOSC domain-containing protein YiiM
LGEGRKHLKMQLLAISVGRPRAVRHGHRRVRTGIFKTPVAGRVSIHTLGVEGDGQADLRVHGGVDMAVYAYPVEHYPFWEKELGRQGLAHGQFGENLTVSGLTEDAVRVGDIYRMGKALLQVSQPRIPCYKLGMRMDAGPDFPQRFLRSRRLGFYLRVLEEGEVGAGDPIELVDRDDGSVCIAEFIEVSQFNADDTAGLERALASRGLSEAWRRRLEKMLDNARPVRVPKEA